MLNILTASSRKVYKNYYYVNVVIKCSQSFYTNALERNAEAWQKRTVITDKQKYDEYFSELKYEEDPETGFLYPINQCNFNESDFKCQAYLPADPMLTYLTKFDVYWFNSNVRVNTATDGLIKYLNELYEIKHLDNVKFYDLLTTLESLHHFS